MNPTAHLVRRYVPMVLFMAAVAAVVNVAVTLLFDPQVQDVARLYSFLLLVVWFFTALSEVPVLLAAGVRRVDMLRAYAILSVLALPVGLGVWLVLELAFGQTPTAAHAADIAVEMVARGACLPLLLVTFSLLPRLLGFVLLPVTLGFAPLMLLMPDAPTLDLLAYAPILGWTALVAAVGVALARTLPAPRRMPS